MSKNETVATWDDIVAAVADEVDGSDGAEAKVAIARGLLEGDRVLDWAETDASIERVITRRRWWERSLASVGRAKRRRGG